MHQPTQATRTINRRRHSRRTDSCEVQIQTVDAPLTDSDACSHYCLSQDVSASGIRLIADHDYPVRSKLLLTMECREEGWTRITSRVGSVVWTKPDTSGQQCQLGIRFTDVDTPELGAF
ncbi:PilZ domain-containing protein [Thiocystis violacea]|uniref:PilZ domain-containing protein n=1 Tax=Thiocystis violacea TaxID=13725 RepID=UPI001F5B2BED|nr:PilZ domain-containing protein [Thiocystis violacea]